jgi:hypothetical protein
MRRILLLCGVLALLSLGSGCHHMAGVCDCNGSPDGHAAPAVLVPQAVPAAK